MARLLAGLPAAFPRWAPLAQDQYLEARTLLAGYLLSSQGDRMLMAHSVEGRFPFLDTELVELANALPPAFKLQGLDEKRVLKRAAAGLVPESILARKKQPYRAPDAMAFTGPGVPEWVAAVLEERAVAEAGVFEPGAVARLWKKCQATGGGAQFSNADNMALVGVLSTGLLHEQLVRRPPARATDVHCRTFIDRLPRRRATPRPARRREAMPMVIQQRIKQFIVENFYVQDPAELREETSLIDGGYVDSTGMLELIAFLEAEFGIQVEPTTRRCPENLGLGGPHHRLLTRKKASVAG